MIHKSFHKLVHLLTHLVNPKTPLLQIKDLQKSTQFFLLLYPHFPFYLCFCILLALRFFKYLPKRNHQTAESEPSLSLLYSFPHIILFFASEIWKSLKRYFYTLLPHPYSFQRQNKGSTCSDNFFSNFSQEYPLSVTIIKALFFCPNHLFSNLESMWIS